MFFAAIERVSFDSLRNLGHNSKPTKLDLAAQDARAALDGIANSEGDIGEYWLAYGAALNDGRAEHKSDEQFGEWIVRCKLRLSDEQFGKWLVSSKLD